MNTLRLFASAALCFPLVGCLDANRDSTADKGEEDDADFDSKADSFAAPTDHGVLAFGPAQQASFTDRDGFHAWTFKLSGNAQVDLRTAIGTTNLDTVMYLYKRNGRSWGTAIDKNDDANGTTAASALKKRLDAGDYRIVIKAFKRTQRGSFSVSAACTGAGCGAPPQCPAPESPRAPANAQKCATSLANIFANSQIESQSETTVDVSQRCNLGQLQRRALDFFVGSADEPDSEIEIRTTTLSGSGNEGGTLIDVTDGRDEGAMTYVFDASGALVLGYLHDQSPSADLYCSDANQVADMDGIESCVGALVNVLPHRDGDAGDVSVSGRVGSLASSVSPAVRGAMRSYARSRSIAASTSVSATGASWGDFTKAAIVSVSAANAPTIRYLATDEYVVLEAPASGAPTLRCEAVSSL